MSDERLRQDFDGCITLYKDFMKHLIADNRRSLGIVASSTNNASGNKSVTFSPEDRYYDSNEWYALSKNEKDKVLKACSNINVEKNSTKSGGQFNSGVGIKNGHGNGSLKLLCLRIRSGNRRGICRSLILRLSPVQTMKS